MRLEIHGCCVLAHPPATIPRVPLLSEVSAYPHQRRSSRQSSTEGVSQEKLKEAQLTSMQMRANHPVHLRESSSHGPPERRRNSAIPMCGFALASNFLHRTVVAWCECIKRKREGERAREIGWEGEREEALMLPADFAAPLICNRGWIVAAD